MPCRPCAGGGQLSVSRQEDTDGHDQRAEDQVLTAALVSGEPDLMGSCWWADAWRRRRDGSVRRVASIREDADSPVQRYGGKSDHTCAWQGTGV